MVQDRYRWNTNIYKYMITWRSPHQYKVIITLDVERFLSDTVADLVGEGARVDLSIIAWKFSVNFRIFSFPQGSLCFLSERNLRSLNKKVTWIRPRLTNYTLAKEKNHHNLTMGYFCCIFFSEKIAYILKWK